MSDANPEDTDIGVDLKEAAVLTNAAWSAVAERVGGAWVIRAAYHLSKSAQAALIQLLSKTTVDAWLCGALSGGHSRSGTLPKETGLGVERIFAFPVKASSQAILVGASQQSADDQRIWKLTASLFASRAAQVTQTFLPDLQPGFAYDLPLALDRLLAVFVRTASCQGAWLAIRRGESLDVQAVWNHPKGKGVSLEIDSNPILRRVNRTLADTMVKRGQPAWKDVHATIKAGTKVWVCLPLVIGQRLIGAVALWRREEFTSDEWKQLRDLAVRAASSVEVVVTFAEMTVHLRRLAILNDFALTVSSAQNLDQIVRRIFGLLARAFGTEWIALYLLSMDEQMLREYRSHEGKVEAQSLTLFGHPIQAVMKEGRLRRVGDISASDVLPIHDVSRSALIVPLRYRSHVIGILSIESPRADAFSQYDEHLIVVIASHLAGLVEYGRLREEAEGRARSLGLIHEVVQQVIGLTNKSEVAQITSDLLAQYFKYDLAAILLLGEEQNFNIQGFGGARASAFKKALSEEKFIVNSGITGRVLSTGTSILVNDTSRDKHYRPLGSWNALSEMCVALKDGARILGIIDVQSLSRNAFTPSDLLAMESLAGILASVVFSADQYQRLQITVRQLRAMQAELKTRMEAQRAAEIRLVQAAKLAAVGEMAAGIAHELNNPLTTVTGFSELILDELAPEAAHRTELEMVLREARRASDVVRRLLDFSRQGESTRAGADINEIVKDVIALTQHLIHTSGVEITVELVKDLPWASVDRNQIKQVLLNLVHNALQAMPNGGKLSISTQTQSRESRSWITMSVCDTGIGIASEDKSRIFEPFFTTRGSHGGTGLGLSVTYGIVTDHGGTIEVESRMGAGSTFTVWLPL